MEKPFFCPANLHTTSMLGALSLTDKAKFRRFPRPDLKVRTFFLTEQEILEASSGAEI